jgi:ATP-dependent DNA helicase DinG
LEDVAGNYFGISVSNLRVEDLARDVEASLQHNASCFPRRFLERLGACGNDRNFSSRCCPLVRDALPSNPPRVSGRKRRRISGTESIALTRLAGELEGLPQKPEEIFNFVRRAQELQAQLGYAMESDDRNTVFWIERRGGRGSGNQRRASGGPATEGNTRGRQNVFLQATPIDVGPILREYLWSKLECAVLTSATLAVGGGFEYIRQRLGLEHARESVLPSHFDYQSQALFYVPPDLPDTRAPQFAPKAAETVRKVLEVTRGRAFVLFTSYSQMNDIYERLLGTLDFPMLRQGDSPKSALLEEFRLTPNAVLFATSSFWQGVDVQGEQLSCVIIDRLPFAVPSDPIVAARVKAIDGEGGNAFFQYQVPAAVITLKQGFGRLIRSLHDRGLLVLLDNRILKKQYGRVFIDSLPNYKKTTDMRVVEEFFGVGN